MQHCNNQGCPACQLYAAIDRLKRIGLPPSVIVQLFYEAVGEAYDLEFEVSTVDTSSEATH